MKEICRERYKQMTDQRYRERKRDRDRGGDLVSQVLALRKHDREVLPYLRRVWWRRDQGHHRRKLTCT